MSGIPRLFLSSGNTPQGEMLLRLALLIADKVPESRLVVVSDDLEKDYQNALKALGAQVHILDNESVEELRRDFSSEAHPLGKIAKPVLLASALEHYCQGNENVGYMDPDVLIQSDLSQFDELARNQLVVMAAESIPSLQNPGVAAKLERAVSTGALTASQVASFEPEVNTGFQYGSAEAMLKYLTEFLGFMRSDAMQEFYTNSKGRSDSWHDQDFFRAYLRASPDRSWLHLASTDQIATLNGDAFFDVEISAATPVVTLPNGQLPDVVHFAGGAWRRNAAALGYFESAPTTLPRQRHEPIDILRIEEAARRFEIAEKSAHNWRQSHDKLREEHESLTKKWNDLKARYQITLDELARKETKARVKGIPEDFLHEKRHRIPSAQRVLSTIALGDANFRMGIALMCSARALSSDINRYVIYTDDETDTSFLSVPEYIEIRPCGKNRELYPNSPYAWRMDKSTPLVDPSCHDATVLYLDPDTIICREVLDALFDEIEAQSILVHATELPDDADWMTRRVKTEHGESTEGFNLSRRAKAVGINIPNMSLRAGVLGRAANTTGWEFSNRVDELLRAPPFAIWANSQYLNDEPFIAIAYLEVKARYGLQHRPLPRSLYSGLSNDEHTVMMDENGRIHVDEEVPGIVCFAKDERRNTELYRAILRRFAPLNEA